MDPKSQIMYASTEFVVKFVVSEPKSVSHQVTEEDRFLSPGRGAISGEGARPFRAEEKTWLTWQK